MKSKKIAAKKFLWITDPWSTLDVEHDTTLRLAQEAEKLGHESWWCDVKSIRWLHDRTVLEASRMQPASFTLSAPETRNASDFDSLQYRVDPPVDLAYLQPLQILRVGSGDAEIVNPIDALLIANEKLEGMLIPQFAPPSIASSQWDRLLEFGESEKKTVMKPLHTAQSNGIELLDWTSASGVRRARKLISDATLQFERPVLLQRYLKAIEKGETRLWFLDGKLLASARKLPLRGDFRVNIDQGSKLVAHSPTALEKSAARAIGKRLRALEVRLAAVDLIDAKVTDFNITSPGLILQMEKVTGKNLARKIVQALVVRRF
jgi:glutathione synthase